VGAVSRSKKTTAGPERNATTARLNEPRRNVAPCRVLPHSGGAYKAKGRGVRYTLSADSPSPPWTTDPAQGIARQLENSR